MVTVLRFPKFRSSTRAGLYSSINWALNFAHTRLEEDSLFQPRLLLGILKSMFLVIIVLSILTSYSSFANVSDPGALSSTTPSPAESGMPEKILRKEAREIRRKFLEVLDLEREKLRMNQNRSRREGKAGRRARKKEWDTREVKARQKFFEENTHGAERRRYFHDFNDRRKAFYELLKTEEKQQKNALDARWKALKESQRVRLNALEDYLKRLEMPPNHLLEQVN